MKTAALFLATALVETVGCGVPHPWRQQVRSIWLPVPVPASVALFA